MFSASVRSLWVARNLLVNLVRRDLTVRYKSTVLGFFWTFAKPLAYMTIYHVVFTRIIPIEQTEPRIPYSLHILAGLLPWTFFTGATSEAMNSILASANLVRKVKLPLEIFPLAAVCSHAVNFGLAMLVLMGGIIALGLAPGPAILLLPFLFAIQFIMVLAVSLLLSALNVFYRDVSSIWEVILAAWFYATPIIYPVYKALDYFAGQGWTWAEWVYLANPMAPIVIAYRRIMLYAALESPKKEFPNDMHLFLALLLVTFLSCAFLIFAHRVFVRLSRRFADQL